LKEKLLKLLYIFLGSISLALGVLGIVVPGLPTTPFLLLTAGLFMKSSPALYNWVISNRYLGPYIINYKRNNGLTLRQKRNSIFLMWIMISISIFIMIPIMWLKMVVATAGLVGTSVIVFVVPNAIKNSEVFDSSIKDTKITNKNP
jgi:uncharacterized protein